MTRTPRAKMLKARRNRPVTARTARRRAKQHEAAQAEQAHGGRPVRSAPETLGQARVWQRKNGRYLLAGLCEICASAAAWGHAEGFGTLEAAGRIPCQMCQPLVNKFDTPGPRGSRWRKILTKLEYLDEERLGQWLDDHDPDG